MRQAGLDVQSIDAALDEHRKIVVAHGTADTPDLGAKQVDQAHTLEAGHYRRQFTLERLDIHEASVA